MGFSTSDKHFMDKTHGLDVLQVLMCFMIAKSKAKHVPLNSC